jgi:hypothetical protein
MYSFVSHSFTVARKRDKISIEERFKAIDDELVRFFLRDVIPPFGEFHYE